ncbi:hypothetical protein P4S72_15610 [Vibrio sp. PP-XX7]
MTVKALFESPQLAALSETLTRIEANPTTNIPEKPDSGGVSDHYPIDADTDRFNTGAEIDLITSAVPGGLPTFRIFIRWHPFRKGFCSITFWNRTTTRISVLPC